MGAINIAKSKKIKVAIAGVGNCAQALVHSMEYYRNNPEDTRGLMNTDVAGYKVTDIKVVAAFDINADKVGKDLSEAIFAIKMYLNKSCQRARSCG